LLTAQLGAFIQQRICSSSGQNRRDRLAVVRTLTEKGDAG
jgi:hypothetical protein